MRQIATLLGILLSLPASGQGAVPDTTDTANYYPLEVGNRWEYVPDGGVVSSNSPSYFRTTIVGDTLIDGVRWFVRRAQAFRNDVDTRILDSDAREAIRFDPEAATVVRWTGTQAVLDFPCRLDGPLAEGADAACSDGPYLSYAKRTETVDVAGVPVETVALRFDGTVPGPTFAAGIGDIGQAFEESGGRDLAFASVGGEAYGTPVEGMPNLPDPTPPASYFPLHVGDQSVFYEMSVVAHGYTRRTVERDTVIGGRPYFVITWDKYDLRSDAPTWRPGRRGILRYDSTTTNVLQWNEVWTVPEIVVCRLGADLNVEVECGDGTTSSYYEPTTDHSVVIGGKTYEVLSIKYPGPFAVLPQPPGFASGIGMLEWNAPANAVSRFEYARIGSVEYGTYPVAADDAPEASRLGVRVTPTPASGPVAVTLTIPEAAWVTVEAFDALGRRVARTEAALPAGPAQVALDAGAWAPGHYVVRVTAGAATASVSLVRR